MTTTITVVDLGTDHVRTTIARSVPDVDNHIRDFVSNRNNEKKLISLEMKVSLKLHFSENRSEIAILQLYDGTKCLIIQLRDFKSLPASLFNFLQLPDFTFVGIGIKQSLWKLERQYGVGWKNAVDVRELAAKVTGEAQLGFCGVDKLALKVVSLKLEKPMSVVFDDWGAQVIDKKQIKFAVANVYAYYKIADKLLTC